MKRYIIVLSIIVLFIIAFSCEKGVLTLEVNCGDCWVPEPDSFDLSVDLTISSEYDSVVYLQFYKGNVESGELIGNPEVVTTPRFYYLVPVNEDYSVEASYCKDGKTIIAIDGDKIVSQYNADACDKPCWIIKGGLLDVRMKY